MDYALIGCGRIAVNHIKAAQNNGLRITAVCDVKAEAMENLLVKTGLGEDRSIQRFTDYREMLAKRKPQLAAIATESGLHAKIALDCIDYGIPVIIEKPMRMRLFAAAKRGEFRFALATRTALILLCRKPVRLWKAGALDGYPMGPCMSAGTAAGIITNKLLGGEPGRRTVDA